MPPHSIHLYVDVFPSSSGGHKQISGCACYVAALNKRKNDTQIIFLSIVYFQWKVMLECYVDGPRRETIDDGKLLKNCFITEKQKREILSYTTIELQSESYFVVVFASEKENF